jgi:hypothetical protein
MRMCEVLQVYDFTAMLAALFDECCFAVTNHCIFSFPRTRYAAESCSTSDTHISAKKSTFE